MCPFSDDHLVIEVRNVYSQGQVLIAVIYMAIRAEYDPAFCHRDCPETNLRD